MRMRTAGGSACVAGSLICLCLCLELCRASQLAAPGLLDHGNMAACKPFEV